MSFSLRTSPLALAVAVLLLAACAGTEEDPPAQGQTSETDASVLDADPPDSDPTDTPPDLPDLNVPPDVAPDPGSVDGDTGPPPECTEETSWKCEDNDICTEDSCTDGVCIHAQPPTGCCKTDGECDDGVPCTTDGCNPTKSECIHSFETNACCVTVDDCAEATSCQTALCAGHQCVYTVESSQDGCACASNLDCGDGSACTNDTCEGGVCAYSLSGAAGCCLTDGDCGDGDDETVDQCQAGTCWNGPGPCQDEADCQGPNVCGDGACLDGACVYDDGCCLLDSACDDGHDATQDLCVDGICLNQLGPSAPCVDDASCAVDGNPCVSGTCHPEAASCTVAPTAGEGCCESAADCVGGDACTLYECVDFQCVSANGPGAVAHWTADWDDGTLGGWTVEGDGKAATWQVVSFQAISAPNSLYYGQLPEKDYDVGATQGTVTSAPIVIPEDLTGVYLTFWRNVATEPFVTTDLFRLEIYQGAWTELWNKNADGGPGLGWQEVTLPLTITANATIQLRFVFDSVDEKQNATLGVLVDDVRLMKPCAP